MIKPKILCTGSPRSGTSLLNILMSYFKDLNVFTDGTPPRLFHECDVFTTQQRGDGKLWNDYIGMTPLSISDILKKDIKVIITYRDGRDCFVSARKMRPKEIEEGVKNKEISVATQYYAIKEETTYWYGPNLNEVDKWFNASKELLKTQEEIKGTELEKNLLVIKYEDLAENPSTEMEKLEKFVGFPLNPGYKNFYNDVNEILYKASPLINDKPNPDFVAPVVECSSYEGAIGSDYNHHRPIEPNSGRWRKPIHHKRIKDILEAYGEKLPDMLIKLGYESNKKWIDELN
jgi:hypothetical protein